MYFYETIPEKNAAPVKVLEIPAPRYISTHLKGFSRDTYCHTPQKKNKRCAKLVPTEASPNRRTLLPSVDATLPSEADRTDETNRALEQKREMSAQIQEMQRRVKNEQTGEEHREKGLEKGRLVGRFGDRLPLAS